MSRTHTAAREAPATQDPPLASFHLPRSPLEIAVLAADYLALRSAALRAVLADQDGQRDPLRHLRDELDLPNP